MGKKRALKVCQFRSEKEKREALRNFLRNHGDDLPPEAVKKATNREALQEWTMNCDEQGVAAAMRYEHNDWYLCTVKNAAVRPDRRGQGHGSRLYVETSRRALRARNKDGTQTCLVLAADVTVANKPSIRALERAGFRRVSRFRWSRKAPPADVMHFVRLSARVYEDE